MRVRMGSAVTVAAIAAAVAACALGLGVDVWEASTDRQSVVDAVLNQAVAFSFALAGGVIAAARPRNRVGWTMLAGGAVNSLGGAAVALAHHGIVATPGSLPAVAVLAIGGSALRALGWYAFTLAVPAVFPEARYGDSPWLRRLLVVIAIAAVIDPLTDDQAGLTDLGSWHNPVAERPWDLLSPPAFLAHVPGSAVATVWVLVLLVRRWRGGDALRRQQLGLFACAAALPVIAAPVALSIGGGDWVFGACALPLPFAIGVAVLARGLYDLRTAVNRGLVWVLLSAVVAAIYALVIVGTSGLLHVGRDVAWLPWVAAAAVAVAFAPLRDALQRALNRITFGRWDEPYDVLAALGQRLEASADVDRLLEAVTMELEGLGLRDVVVRDAEGQAVAGDSTPAEHEHVLVLTAYGEAVGTLAYRAGQTPLRDRDRRLLDDLAGHLGGVLHARRLTTALQQALERLVVAREEERRRLRRDLHDGLGPALAGHLLRLDLIAARVGPDGPASADVDALRADLRATVLDVRRVVEGLRPPSLDELGLLGAIAQVAQRLLAGGGIRLELSDGHLPALPAAVEVAAYRIVTEAVTNVVRHAGASVCRVDLEPCADRLVVRIADDGRGLGALTGAGGSGGHGLHTMRERAEELGGRLAVDRGDGTTVTAELPLTPRPRAVVLRTPTPQEVAP